MDAQTKKVQSSQGLMLTSLRRHERSIHFDCHIKKGGYFWKTKKYVGGLEVKYTHTEGITVFLIKLETTLDY